MLLKLRPPGIEPGTIWLLLQITIRCSTNWAIAGMIWPSAASCACWTMFGQVWKQNFGINRVPWSGETQKTQTSYFRTNCVLHELMLRQCAVATLLRQCAKAKTCCLTFWAFPRLIRNISAEHKIAAEMHRNATLMPFGTIGNTLCISAKR